VAVYEQNGQFIIASCGRDRTVQVFHKNGATLDLMQTLDEHVGAVTGLLFTSNGSQLISCSTDRTVVVREALSRTEKGKMATAFMILRTITLKATPVSMTLLSDRNDILFVSAIDRNVHKYNLRNGQLSESFKVSDSEGGDAVVLSSLAHVPTYNGQNRIAGVSSTDKSIRLYDENGCLLGRDWGHTEGVTDLTVITSAEDDASSPRCTYLVSVAADGTVFIWSFGSRSNSKQDLSRSMELMGMSTPNKELLVNKPPLRRVLSQSEMARLQQKSPDEDLSTPTGKVRPKLEKRTSRFSLAQTPKLEPSPMSTYDPTSRRKARGRSPSPPASPKTRTLFRKSSNPAMSVRSRTKSGGAPVESLNNITTSTEQMCRNLRIYRKKLTTSTDNLSPENLAAVERELGLTLRAVSEKAMKARGVADETVMVKMLSQYSERLLEMLDEKFAATIAKQAQLNGSNSNNNSGETTPLSAGGGIGEMSPGTSPTKGSISGDHPTIHEEGEH
jgi:WD domain, G-beta repeat